MCTSVYILAFVTFCNFISYCFFLTQTFVSVTARLLTIANKCVLNSEAATPVHVILATDSMGMAVHAQVR